MIWWTAFLWASVCINGCDNPLWMMKEVVVVIQLLSRVWLLQLHGLAPQAPLSMGFPRQEYCSGLPFPSPGDLPDPGIEPASPALAGGFFPTETPRTPGHLTQVLIRLEKLLLGLMVRACSGTREWGGKGVLWQCYQGILEWGRVVPQKETAVMIPQRGRDTG